MGPLPHGFSMAYKWDDPPSRDTFSPIIMVQWKLPTEISRKLKKNWRYTHFPLKTHDYGRVRVVSNTYQEVLFQLGCWPRILLGPRDSDLMQHIAFFWGGCGGSQIHPQECHLFWLHRPIRLVLAMAASWRENNGNAVPSAGGVFESNPTKSQA